MWDREGDMTPVRPGLLGWIRVLVRGGILSVVLSVGVVISAVLRLIESPFYGVHRPWTPWVTQAVCRVAFRILGVGYSVQGQPMTHPGAVVSNHVSWLDIFALNAAKRVYFVSKAEVARWPGIGLLARITGTVFIARDRRYAQQQTQLFTERLRAGHKLLFFPEGTSTDGLRVLPFKSTLFQSFLTPELQPILWVQPVTLIYYPPEGEPGDFYGWWGDMDFGPHLLKTLAAPRQGAVSVVFHAPLRVAEFAHRKDLSAALEAEVVAGMPPERQLRG